MRLPSHQHKIRIIQHSNSPNGTTTWGVTIPAEYKEFFNTFVNIIKDGDKLVLVSGCRPEMISKKEMKSHSTVIERVKIK